MITRESDGGKYLKWAETSADKVDNMAIIERFANESLDDERVLRFSNELHLQLQSYTSKEAFRLVISVEEGSGLEAWRILCARNQPRTPGTKRTILRAILNSSPAKDLMHVDSVLMHVEDLCRRYEELASHPLSEDVKVSVIMDICLKQLKEHLELIYREENYQRVRAEIVQYTQRHRSQSQEQLVAMDIGAVTQQTLGEWDHWNEWSNDCANSWTPTWNAAYNEEFEQQETGADIQYVGGKNGNSQYFQCPGYMKGVGKKGGTVTAGMAHWGCLKGDQKGYKGWGKGQKGGKGKGKTGSPSGGFQGYCHHCGEWGHSISRCKLKDGDEQEEVWRKPCRQLGEHAFTS